MTHVHCPDCGFQNLEASQYCAKCGAALLVDEGGTTMSFTPIGEDEVAVERHDLAVDGPSLVVRRAGRAVETFGIGRKELTIGRSPDCDVFLDDVTVSRVHALVRPRPDGVWIEDQGSLNGTFINRRRVDAARLADADEVQIGKYRLTFLER